MTHAVGPRRPRYAALLVAGAAAGTMLFALAPIPSPVLIALISLAAQVAICLTLRKAFRPRRWTTALAMAVLWVAYFPLRLLIVVSNQGDLNLHPLVRSAQPGDLQWVAIITTLGLAAFALGALGQQKRCEHASLGDQRLCRPSTLRQLAGLGLLLSVLPAAIGLESGLLKQISLVYLFAIAGLAFKGRIQRELLVEAALIAAVACAIGVGTGFKEEAALPLVALAIGAAAARPVSRTAAALLLVMLCGAYLAVQGHRIAISEGTRDSYAQSAVGALFDHDLGTGRATLHKSAPQAATNLVSGIARRFAGADSLLILRAKTPGSVPFQHGRAIWQPVVSVIPGAARLVTLDFPQLSLGRYFSLTFQSLSTANDPSSQAITMIGDLYLNGGSSLALLGMVVVGAAVGRIDDRFPSSSALGAATLAYVGSSLAGIERNVAYVGVNTAIRLVVIATLLSVAARISGAGTGGFATGGSGLAPRGREPDRDSRVDSFGSSGRRF